MKNELRILHLEDNPVDAAVVHQHLTRGDLSCSIEVVEAAEDFVAALDRGPFDLILADHTLPAFDGLSALALARDKVPDVPFLFVSGTIGEERAISAMKSGASDYVLKSNLQRLVPAVERALKEAEELAARKRGEQRIEHLNRALLAVRTIDQLIARETDPERLIAETCALLVAHRSYSGAFVILTDADGKPTAFAETGFEEGRPLLAKAVRQGTVPPCCEQARVQGGVFRVRNCDQACADCPRFDCRAWTEGGYFCLQHGDRLLGYLSVTLEPDQTMDSEEESIFSDLARDVAQALYALYQDKTVQQMQGERELMEAELRQAQKMEAVGRLAGGVAHDFNNMLTVILGSVELALARLNPGDPAHRHLQQIKRAGEHSAELTRQLLAFSRKQIRQPMVLQLHHLIADQKKMLDRLIGEDVKIDLLPSEELWDVQIDPSQFHQIVANLAVNARDAIRGVGTVTIGTDNVTLGTTYSRRKPYVKPGEYVRLTFRDTGEGMDAATLEKIFEPFFTTKGRGIGTGLGLSTVYGIVNQNDGIIDVFSQPGVGTEFHLYFPRFQGQATKPAEAPGGPSGRGSETILVVEDEEQILEVVETMLERFGYTILAAARPEEACLLCEKSDRDIHLLLTDVVMPGMSGKELERRIVALKPGIKTLFMSGYTADVVAHRGIVDGGMNLINKPFSAEELASKVRAVLDA
ncbi:MAG: response regulator [Deltaproteobacteria bacterium]|nr:response regulator [Deltaproteobacteria bacterium]